jgi:uncharacterized membrane protein YkoI
MTIKAAIPAVLLATALVGAPAFAATQGSTTMPETSPQKSPMPPAAAAPSHARNLQEPMRSKARFDEFSDRVNSGDITAFASAEVSLSQAIADAERDMHGKVVEAVFKAAPDQPHYVVWLTTNSRVLTGWIDAEHGTVTPLVGSTTLRQLYPRERAEFIATDEARTSLADAVRIAQEKSGNRPIAASFEVSGRTRAYDIAVVKGSALHTVWVSPHGQARLASG